MTKWKTKCTPLYPNGGDEGCLEMLSKESSSPDAQKCLTFGCRSFTHVHGFRKILSIHLTF